MSNRFLLNLLLLQALHLPANIRPLARPLVLPVAAPSNSTSSTVVARAARERLDAAVAVQVSAFHVVFLLKGISSPRSSTHFS